MSAAKNSFRPDIEGLRAVAVVLVVLDHLVGWPTGGFVGVDVFFVVSGFLITGLLIKDTDRMGRLSFRTFYARRARRILPAALTVLLAVTVASRLVYAGTTRVQDTQIDALWALGFGANIHFSQIGTDYFDATRAPSLVQHFWSLAVEEQFYLVWPIVILIVLTLLGKFLSQKKARFALLAVVGTATVSSFVWGVHETATTPATAYFSTPARAWELGVGAFVAVAATCFPGFFQRLGKIGGPLSLLGLIGVLTGAFVVNSTSGFPVPWAALPVLATALIIVAGIGSPTRRWGMILTNPVSGYLGRISYSLYLIHWPVLLLATSLLVTKSWLRYPIVIFIMMSLSVASYQFIEAPFRKFSFRGRPLEISRRDWRARSSKPAFAAICLATFALTFWVFVPLRPIQTFGLPLSLSTATPSSRAIVDDSVAQPSKQLAKRINDALASSSFPRFNPPLDQLTTESAIAHYGRCAEAINLANCTFGRGGANAKIAVVIGDSYAMASMPMIDAALPSADWKIYGIERGQCPGAYVSVLDGQKPPVRSTACDKRHQFAIDKAKSLNPDLIILTGSYSYVNSLTSKATGDAAISEWQAGLVKTINMLKPGKHRRVLTITGPPPGISLQSCVSAQSVPADCVATLSAQWQAVAASEKEVAATTHTSFSDTHLWFCSENSYCPAFVETTPMRWDTGHLTPAYAKSLGPELAGVINNALK